MKYHFLGKSNLRISEIGFGCMSLKSSEKENIGLLHEALDAGINFFDTADLYDHGKNELTVGKAFKNRRTEIVLATKAGNQWRADGSGWDWNPRKEYVLKCIDESLHRLQTDHVDLYQLHGGTLNDPIDETIETFELLKQQGKILHYGISSIRPNVIREYIQRSNIVSVMTQYSLLDRRPEETNLDLLKANSIGVLVRGSLAQGLLIDKPAREYLNYTTGDVARAADVVQSLSCNERNATQTSIHFVLQHPAVTSAVVGIRNSSQLKEALKTTETNPLSESELKLLREVLPANKYTDHR